MQHLKSTFAAALIASLPAFAQPLPTAVAPAPALRAETDLSAPADLADFGGYIPDASPSSQTLAAHRHSDAFTIHPGFSVLISGLNASYEGAMGSGLWNYEIQGYLGYTEHRWTNPLLCTGLGFGARRYLLDRGAGTYVEPELDLLNVHRFEQGPDAGNNVVVVVPNIRMGYRWTWNVFTMDVSAGAFYYNSHPTWGKLTADDPNAAGLLPMVQYALGVPF